MVFPVAEVLSVAEVQAEAGNIMERKKSLPGFLTEEELESLALKIAEIESVTSGELKICFHLKRSYKERKKTSRDLAIEEFHKSGMTKTKEKTGVLLYFLLDEKIFEIIADEGINNKIDEQRWKTIVEVMSGHLKTSRAFSGISEALDHIGLILKDEFPCSDDNEDEISNEVEIN